MILRVTCLRIFAPEEGKTHALGWNLEGDWLDHTGLYWNLHHVQSKEAGSCDLFV